MDSLVDLEKKINSELTTKIKESKVLHNQLYLSINSIDLLGNQITITFVGAELSFESKQTLNDLKNKELLLMFIKKTSIKYICFFLILVSILFSTNTWFAKSNLNLPDEAMGLTMIGVVFMSPEGETYVLSKNNKIYLIDWKKNIDIKKKRL